MNKHREICKIVIIYALVGCSWIYFSDMALGWLIDDPQIMVKFAIFKGLLYIVITSVLLYFLIARLDTKIKQSPQHQTDIHVRVHRQRHCPPRGAR